MVGQVLDERRIPSLKGELAIAHCRYSTTGSTIWENAQPTLRLGPRRALAIGHNGNLVNTRAARTSSRAAAAGSREHRHGAADRAPRRRAGCRHGEPCGNVLPRVRGAFSLVILDDQRVIGVRDPFGFRPLVLGRLPMPATDDGAPGLWDDGTGGWILASETAALDIVGATSCATWSPARSSCSRRARTRSRSASPRRGAVRLRADLLRSPGLVHGGSQPVRGAAPDGDAARHEHAGRRGPRDAGARHRRAGRGGYAEPFGIPYREGIVRNRYAGARSSSRARPCASAASPSS